MPIRAIPADKPAVRAKLVASNLPVSAFRMADDAFNTGIALIQRELPKSVKPRNWLKMDGSATKMLPRLI